MVRIAHGSVYNVLGPLNGWWKWQASAGQFNSLLQTVFGTVPYEPSSVAVAAAPTVWSAWSAYREKNVLL
eukprot:scaffold5078_cov63-Phaeocystis_antarctica.AAC.6